MVMGAMENIEGIVLTSKMNNLALNFWKSFKSSYHVFLLLKDCDKVNLCLVTQLRNYDLLKTILKTLFHIVFKVNYHVYMKYMTYHCLPDCYVNLYSFKGGYIFIYYPNPRSNRWMVLTKNSSSTSV